VHWEGTDKLHVKILTDLERWSMSLDIEGRQDALIAVECVTAILLHRVEEDRNILLTVKGRKANWVGHILHGNCLSKHVIEGKVERRIEVTGRREMRRKQLLDILEESKRYWNL
jgi:hypothetical protein